MFVVPLSKALEVCRRPHRLPCHEDLMEEEALVEWEPGMGPTLFFSHTWLGNSHPDPTGVKQELMVSILEQLLDGTFCAVTHWVSTVLFGDVSVSGKQTAALAAGGFVWLDFWSIPQRNRETQAKAISSITTYVADTELFIVLAGPWSHENSAEETEVP